MPSPLIALAMHPCTRRLETCALCPCSRLHRLHTFSPSASRPPPSPSLASFHALVGTRPLFLVFLLTLLLFARRQLHLFRFFQLPVLLVFFLFALLNLKLLNRDICCAFSCHLRRAALALALLLRFPPPPLFLFLQTSIHFF